MATSTTTDLTIINTPSNSKLIVAYFSLIVTMVGTFFNLLTFIVLCRSTFRNTRTRPTLHYMRAMAIFDILMLYGWNFDHYLDAIYGFPIQRTSIPLCRFLSFFNYFVPQASAWFRVFVSLDRYLSLSRLHKTWFSHSKNVLLIIGCIIICCTLINALFFFYGCSYNTDGTISALSWAFEIFPLWDYVNLAVYNCIPFILMSLFNSGVIYHLIRLNRTRTIQNSQIQHRSISITLVITTFLFLIMTIPATVGFCFFLWTDITILRVLDGFLYSYHALSFPLYMITFDEFRNEFVALIRCRTNNPRVAPSTATVTRQVNTIK